MKRKLNISMVLILVTVMSVLFVSTNITKVQAASAPPTPIKDQVIVSLLNPYIDRQVKKTYGPRPPLYSVAEAKILSLTQNSNQNVDFEVKIQIQTFRGPHNPPYGCDTFTFRVQPYSVELLHFEHIVTN
jgi:hypothetical protein